MTDYRFKKPAFLWGSGFANQLDLGYPFDNVSAGDEPREGSETRQAPSGVEDAWTIGTDYILEADLRYIPQTTTTTPAATGWDGATGVRAFLAWARDKNVVRFIPDSTVPATYIDCYLVEPMTGAPTPESDSTRRFRIKLRNAATAFDGY